jgi:hypothetical protein
MDQSTGRSIRTRPHRGERRDRGATLTEYALGIAFVCVLCLGAISFLTDTSAEELDARSDRIGSPDLEAGAPGGTDGGSDSGGTTDDGGDPGDGPPAALTAGGATAEGTHRGNNWDATVTLTMQGDGSPVVGLLVTGRWTLYVEGAVQPAENPVSCTTGTNGECVFTRDDMEYRDKHSEVTKAVFVVSGYTYTPSDPDQTYTIPPAPAQTIEVTRPPT